MNIDEKRILARFRDYVDTFSGTGEGVRLKYLHSLKVSGLCRQIAEGLSLSAGEAELAWVIGLLHDIGRFEQLRRYHTFIDRQSMDHARYGVHYLFDEGHIRDFVPSPDEDDVIRAAIGDHNVYRVRPDLTERQDLFTRIVRDADKIDIFRVYVLYRDTHLDVWHTDWSDLPYQAITDTVMAQARARQSVRTEDKRTFIDFYVGVLCLYFDLSFAKSRVLAWQQGNYEKLLAFHSQNPDTERKLEEIRQMVLPDRKRV